MNSKIVNTQRK